MSPLQRAGMSPRQNEDTTMLLFSTLIHWQTCENKGGKELEKEILGRYHAGTGS